MTTHGNKAETAFGGIWWSILDWLERNGIECGRAEALHLLNSSILGGLKMGLNQNYRRMSGRFFEW